MTPRTRLSCLVVLLLSGCAFAQRHYPLPSQVPTMPQNVELRVRVVDQRGEPVSQGILVELLSDVGSTVQTAVTGSNGDVSFSQLQPAVYQVRVSGDGIQTYTSDRFPLSSMNAFDNETIHVMPADSDKASGSAPGGTVSARQLQIPEKARAEFAKANAALAKKNLDEAKAHYLKAIAIYPRYSEAYNNLGILAIRANDMATAKEEFTKAVESDPDDASAALNLARFTYSDRDFQRTEELLQRAIAANPNDVQALAIYTFTEFYLEKYDNVISAAAKVHGLSHQQFPDVHLAAARSLVKENRLQDAMVQYKIFLKEAPADSQFAPIAQKELEQVQAQLH